jgi:hypothetical protein
MELNCFTVRRGCDGGLKFKKFCLNSQKIRDTTVKQRGTCAFTFPDHVVSIIPIDAVVPIKIGTDGSVFLKLRTSSVDLNTARDGDTTTGGNGVGAYALCMRLHRDYVGDTVGHTHFEREVALWQSDKPTNLGTDLSFEWINPDGTNYPLVANDNFTFQFYVVSRQPKANCNEPGCQHCTYNRNWDKE